MFEHFSHLSSTALLYNVLYCTSQLKTATKNIQLSMCLQRTNSSSFHWSIAHTNWSWNHFCCRCWMHIWLFLLLLCCFVFLPRRAVFTWCPTHTAPLEYVTRQQKQNVDNLDLDDDTTKKTTARFSSLGQHDTILQNSSTSCPDFSHTGRQEFQVLPARCSHCCFT